MLVIGHDVNSLMAPYSQNNMGQCNPEHLEEDEDGYQYNPQGYHDYFLIGGRYTGKFKLKPGATGEIGEGPLMQPPQSDKTLVAQAVKNAIDFELMETDAVKNAIARYDQAMAIFGELPTHIPLNVLTQAQFKEDGTYPTHEERVLARKIWEKQPRVVAFKMAEETDHEFRLFADDYLITKQEYIDEAKINRMLTYGIVSEEGGWECQDSMDKAEYIKLFAQRLKEADDDTLITIVDCHS
jgi:hypothetical protein